jgi:hypothetical protein
MNEAMKDMAIGLAFMVFYVPVIAAWVMNGDEWMKKVALAMEAFLWPAKPEPKEHADLFAMFGEAADA